MIHKSFEELLQLVIKQAKQGACWAIIRWVVEGREILVNRRELCNRPHQSWHGFQ